MIEPRMAEEMMRIAYNFGLADIQRELRRYLPQGHPIYEKIAKMKKEGE